MNDVHPVTITLNENTRTYTAVFQTGEHFKIGWQSVLKSAYGRADLRCGCKGRGEKRLAVKYYEGSDSYALARFSLSGGQHAADCQYYSASPVQSGEGGSTTGVIDQRPDGSIKIRLEIAMLERGDVDAPAGPSRPPVNRAPSIRQASMKLLGLLHYLWEEAGLNHWKPAFTGKRKASLAYWWINNAADDLWAGQVKLVDNLLLPAFGAETREAERNRLRAAAALADKRRLIVIAPLASFTQERFSEMGERLKISGFHGMPSAYMKTGVWDSTVRRFANAIAAWRSGHGTVAIAQVEIKQGQKSVYATVIDMALMSITAEFVPVDSSYERVVADLLVAQGRSFVKPMRYDAGADLVLPDFILTDTTHEMPMEVFGRADEGYLQRQVEKSAYYDNRYGPAGWWKWEAAANGDASTVPPFPAAR
ncbi:DUF1173 family protein [Massilia aerilata]|uniref:DUF1173 family protein n=1 Tax=Massilia aerilata TaxID=453817 RepID=A0ABW0RZY2_9BURK